MKRSNLVSLVSVAAAAQLCSVLLVESRVLLQKRGQGMSMLSETDSDYFRISEGSRSSGAGEALLPTVTESDHEHDEERGERRSVGASSSSAGAGGSNDEWPRAAVAPSASGSDLGSDVDDSSPETSPERGSQEPSPPGILNGFGLMASRTRRLRMPDAPRTDMLGNGDRIAHNGNGNGVRRPGQGVPGQFRSSVKPGGVNVNLHPRPGGRSRVPPGVAAPVPGVPRIGGRRGGRRPPHPPATAPDAVGPPACDGPNRIHRAREVFCVPRWVSEVWNMLDRNDIISNCAGDSVCCQQCTYWSCLWLTFVGLYFLTAYLTALPPWRCDGAFGSQGVFSGTECFNPQVSPPPPPTSFPWPENAVMELQ